MTVAELIAFLQQQPQDAVVVLSLYQDRADAFMVAGIATEPRQLPLRTSYISDRGAWTRRLYEAVEDGEIVGVLLQ